MRVLISGLFCFLAVAPLAGAERRDPAALPVLSGGYPRAFFFRQSEGLAANPRIGFDDWEKSFSRLMGIMGKTLEEEVPGRSVRNIEFFTRFKQRHPDQLVMLHYNGNARDPRDQQGRFFAGHWLYYNGAAITAAVPAESGETVIRVSDPTLFVAGMGRYRNANEDIGLCERDAKGKPDWSRSEQVKLVSIDRAGSSIRVLRGQYGTQPRSFTAGRAQAAAHVTEGPWGEKSNLLWDYNHSTACPRDSAGRTCDDVLVADLAGHFLGSGDLAAFDGVQFDVLKYSLGAGRGRKRGIDTDGDGVADNGVVGGVDRYAEGTIRFCRSLREKLGEKVLILADGWSIGNQRAFGILNGIEAEGWPSLRDYKVEDWSGGLNRQGFWAANSRPPAFNYINHKYNIDGEIVGSDSPKVGWNIHRLVFAGAVFTDSAICYSLRPPQKAGELVGIWDELWMGQERRLGWLGQPKGAAVHVAAQTPDLLAGKRLTVAGGQITVPSVPADSDLFLKITMRSTPVSAARLFRVQPGEEAAVISYGWINDRDFTYTFYIPDARRREIRIIFEGDQPVTVSGATAHAAPDVVYREFERGVVIANPGPRPYEVDIARMFGGARFRRLRGSSDQDPAVNNGQRVGGSVRLGATDAIFLVRE